jgi:hypothetical protein
MEEKINIYHTIMHVLSTKVDRETNKNKQIKLYM